MRNVSGPKDDKTSVVLSSNSAIGDEGHLPMSWFDDLGADGKPARLGIMGGTFDPVHTGHLACAEMAMDACDLDGVMFMVAANPSLKQRQTTASPEERLEMVRLAIEGNDRFSCSDLELRREGITYTSDTLRQLRLEYPEWVELAFIIGADSLITLPQWHEAEVIKELATIICVSRPGRFDEDELLQSCREEGFNIEHVCAPLLDISSSELRQRVRTGQSIRYLTPDAVCRFVEERNLYVKG